jgi:hypothetical protein
MNTTKTERFASDQRIQSGIDKHLEGKSLFIDNEDMGKPALSAVMKRRIDATQKTAMAKAAYEQALAEERAVVEETAPVVRGIRDSIHVMFRSSLEVLADFGFAPRRPPRPRTLDEKLAIAAKALATREARHTLGPRQRAKIRGAPLLPSSPAVDAPPHVPSAQAPP